MRRPSGKEPTCQCRRHKRQMWVQSLGQEDPLEKEMAAHSSIFAWETPWTEEPGRLQSMGSQSRTQLKQLSSSSNYIIQTPPWIVVHKIYRGLPGGSDDRESACNTGDLGSIPGLGRSPWRMQWLPTPVFLPGEFHGQRSLAGYSSWGRKVEHNWVTHVSP